MSDIAPMARRFGERPLNYRVNIRVGSLRESLLRFETRLAADEHMLEEITTAIRDQTLAEFKLEKLDGPPDEREWVIISSFRRRNYR